MRQPNSAGLHPSVAIEAQGHFSRVNTALAAGDIESALQSFSKLIRIVPNDPQIHLAHGAVLMQVQKLPEAEKSLTSALTLSPLHPQALYEMGKLKLQMGEYPESERFILRSREVGYDSPSARRILAKALIEQLRYEDAIVELEGGLERFPSDVELINYLGLRYRDLGQFKEAAKAFQASLQLQPSQGLAYLGLTQVTQISELDLSLVNQMESLKESDDLNPSERTHLLFGLGKAYNELHEYEKAMACFTEANQVGDEARMRATGFPKERYRRLFEITKQIFTRDYIERKQAEHHSRPAPIFVVGMMRSGTTLVEQILCSHSDVTAGGEIGHWLIESSLCLDIEKQTFDLNRALGSRKKYERILKRMSPDTRFTTDKMPGNYRCLGMLRILFPDAKIIHCTRHPIDTCLSIYMTPFQDPPDYARNFEKLLFTYRQYQDLMTHWQAVLGEDGMLKVKYEDLVENREDVSRRLVAFCGLDWQDGCMQPEKNLRPVATASAWQARQQTYRTSLERWRNYEPWLGSLRELL